MENQTTESTAAASTEGGASSVALKDGLGGIVGIKAGMTQIYTENGDSLAVTVIDLQPATVTQVKRKEKDGYNAVQIGMLAKKAKAASRAEAGHCKASKTEGFYHYQEIRLPENAKMEGIAVGASLTSDFVAAGDFVDLTAISKGKGFQGGMKRFHMAGGFKTHGASVTHRHTGSIGNRADPGKCFKNKKMAGQMGNIRVTVQNVKVARLDLENGVLLVHGSVPGPKSGLVTVRRSVKKVG